LLLSYAAGHLAKRAPAIVNQGTLLVRRAIAALSLAAAVVFAAPRTIAQVKSAQPAAVPLATDEKPEHRLRWQWSRFGAADYIATALIAGIYLYVEFGTKSPAEPNWTGGILFDDGVRDAMVAGSPAGRDRAGTISDFLTLTPQILALVDGALVPVVTDDFNWDVAWQMSVINLQAIAVTGLLSRAGHRYIARERPDVRPCQEDGGYHGLCFGGSNASFPSGHTSAAFAGAGLVCAHHMHLPLYGGTSDTVACVASMTLATGSGVMRIVSDRHYASDIIVGAAIGTGAGLGLPLLLHYRGGESRKTTRARVTFVPLATDRTLGATMFGWF
jgi:membrane-associated phospholipid phosphatase